MELIRLPGYTEEEKMAIARQHLIVTALSKHGLSDQEWSINDEALLSLIRVYTREAGVRNLEREISNLIRKAVKAIVSKEATAVHVQLKDLSAYLGAPKYRYGEIEEKDWIGCVTGLAWTEVGGELLTVEGVMMPGRGKMIVTGNLRDVMKESISAAASYVRSRAHAFGIQDTLFDKKDVHVHLPEAATPKDGPSAGIAMATAVISLMTGIPVHRDVAMTGEVTLRGRVLPIGGLKEKLLAAVRGGIKTVLIPKENERDLDDLPLSVKKALTIIPVSHMDEVLDHALTQPLEPLPYVDPLIVSGEKSSLLPIISEDDSHGFVAH
jgi:ATP-dependent Lon protease